MRYPTMVPGPKAATGKLSGIRVRGDRAVPDRPGAAEADL